MMYSQCSDLSTNKSLNLTIGYVPIEGQVSGVRVILDAVIFCWHMFFLSFSRYCSGI